MQAEEAKKSHEIEFLVDEEHLTTEQRVLTVRAILQMAGLDPSTHYLVELKNHKQVDHRDLDEELHVHKDDKFISVYTGDTPVS